MDAKKKRKKKKEYSQVPNLKSEVFWGRVSSHVSSYCVCDLSPSINVHVDISDGLLLVSSVSLYV